MSDSLTLRDLMARTGVNPITFRSWTRRGAIPKGSGRARGTRYNEKHVTLVLAIQALRARGYGMVKVVKQIHAMSETELAAFAKNPNAPPTPAPATTEATPPASTTTYAHRTLQWVPLIPGLTLLVEPSTGDLVRRLAQEIIDRYAVYTEPAPT